MWSSDIPKLTPRPHGQASSSLWHLVYSEHPWLKTKTEIETKNQDCLAQHPTPFAARLPPIPMSLLFLPSLFPASRLSVPLPPQMPTAPPQWQLLILFLYLIFISENGIVPSIHIPSQK